MPKVSVLIPLYNRRDYIEDCVRSVLNQDYNDFEIIVLDDCSSDGSGELVMGINDSRIRYYRNEQNRGISYTRNRLTSLSSGEYLAILDSDDLAEAGRIRIQVNYLDQNPEICLVAGCARLVNEKGDSLHRHWGKQYSAHELSARLPFENLILQSTVMGRKEFFKLYPYREELKTAEDYDVWLRGLHNHRYAVMGDIVSSYRIHTGNISQLRNTEINSNAVTIRRKYLEEIIGSPIDDAALNGILEDMTGGIIRPFATFRLMRKMYLRRLEKENIDLLEWKRVLQIKWQRYIYKFERFNPLYMIFLYSPLSSAISLRDKVKYAIRCMLFQKNRIMKNKKEYEKIVYDIGFHIGQDTDYYLKKGFKVVAVDADPVLIENGKNKFIKYISNGQLVLVNRAVYEEDDAEVDFFVAENSEWSSLVPEYAGRNNISTRHIRIKTTRLDSLFQKYGMPYFLKIDIEGYDVNALRTLTKELAPKYISVEALSLTATHLPSEAEALATLNQLQRLGYTKFRLVDQTEFTSMNPNQPFYGVNRFDSEPVWAGLLRRYLLKRGYKLKRYNNRDLINARCNHHFEYGSAGPLPEELNGVWLNGNQAANAIKFHLSEAVRLGMTGFWVDWHGRK
jgi:FkbM family methyltransferase